MKILKYAAIVIGVILIAFFSLGLIRSEISYESEVVINKPIEEVWAVMQDDSRISEWLKEVKRIEHLSGEPGKVGAKSLVYVDENGEEMSMEETITAIEEQKHMAMTFTMDFMDMDYKMNLKQLGPNQVKVSSSSVTSGNGLFSKSILAMMGGTMKEQEDLNMQNLKTMIEANTKEY